ncbi:MAG: hypothetical protein LUC17_05310, partial [Oscillospiraceae bacterium]|nr:hypothetical protein [Oscillospiraceae bacterium]
TYMTEILNMGDDDGPDDSDMKENNMAHFAGAGVNVDAGGPPEDEGPAEPPSLGDMVARPPRGVPFEPGPQPEQTEAQGKDNSAWLSWDGKRARIKDLDTYLLNHRQRMKPCTAFDAMSDESNENRLFGECNKEKDFMHFDSYVAPALEQLKDQFPDDYAEYYEPYCEALNNPEQEKCKYLYNPFNYVTQPENTHAAKYNRIRVGASDADTAFTVSMALACKMKEYGSDVNYELVWDKPHCEADYPGEVIDWIKGITL